MLTCFRQPQRSEKVTRLDSAECIAPAAFLYGNCAILTNCRYQESTALDTLFLPMYIFNNNIMLFHLFPVSQ